MKVLRLGVRARRWTLACTVALCLQPGAAPPSEAAPAAQEHGAPLRDATLFLELVVNGQSTGEVVAVDYRDGRPVVRAADLVAVGVRVPPTLDAATALDQVGFAYDSHRQRLEITVPVEWLPSHVLGETRLQERVPARTSLGALFNYDVYATSPAGRSGHVSAWTEQRLFDRWGAISNTGIVRHVFGAGLADSPLPYLRYDTRWSYTDEARLLTVTAGDLTTGALPWTSAVRLGGVLIERNFTARPDIVTYPLPQFAGQAAMPTAVDLFINGSRAVSDNVPPGPFVVTSVPVVEGAGRATVVATDVLGRQTSTTVSFYVASNLLQQGLFDYSVSAGLTRRGFGLESWSYGGPAASGVVRYGLTNYVTVAGHAEGGGHLAAGGLGADLRLRALGVIGAAVAHGGDAGDAGSQYSASYGYTTRRYSVMLRHLQRDSGFTDLSRYPSPAGAVGARLPRRVDQVTGAASPRLVGGTIGAGYFAMFDADGQQTRLVNLSFTRRFLWGTSVYFSANRTMGPSGRRSAQIQVVRQMGHRGSLTASAVSRGESAPQGRVQYSRSAPPGEGLGWTAGYSPATRSYQQADLTWRTRFTQLQGGLYGERTALARWAGLSGSLIVMGREVAAANRVDDAFALVDTGGYADVPVLFENQFVGRTNRRGRLLVPGVSAYYASKFSIDPLGLPSGVSVPTVEQRAAIRRRSGAIVRFPLLHTVAALIALVDEEGRPLPLGLQVTHVETGQRAVVGWDGQTYFERLQKWNSLQVALPDGRSCTAGFPLTPVRGETARVGPLVCRPQWLSE